MSRTSTESLVLKASRSREDRPTTRKFKLGYGTSFIISDATSAVSLKYLSLTKIWIHFEKKTAYFSGVGIQETIIETAHHELAALKNFSPSGDYALLHLENQQRKIQSVNFKIVTSSRIVPLVVRALIQQFATRVYHERIFSGQAENNFNNYQERVDILLSSTGDAAFAKMPSAFERTW